MKSDCSKKLQIEIRSSSCQCWSLHGFQISHFICYQFGFNFWVQSIQNHARHHFKALLAKLLYCSIRIWADALFSDRSSIQICCFAQYSIWNMLFCFCVMFLLRDRRMIEDLSEAIGAALVGNSFSPISLAVLARSDCRRVGKDRCLPARRSDPPKLWQGNAPRARPLISHS